jgi:hypothetical protein
VVHQLPRGKHPGRDYFMNDFLQASSNNVKVDVMATFSKLHPLWAVVPSPYLGPVDPAAQEARCPGTERLPSHKPHTHICQSSGEDPDHMVFPRLGILVEEN